MFFVKQKTAYEVLRSLVGSEMCIRDRFSAPEPQTDPEPEVAAPDPQPQLPAVRFEAAQPKRNPRQIPIEF